MPNEIQNVKKNGNIRQGLSRLLRLKKINGSLIGLILLFIIFSVLSKPFISGYNMMNILRQNSINLILAVGMTFVVLSGGIDLSVGAVMAVVGTLVAGMLSHGMLLGFALVLGLLIGLAFGFFNGLCVTKGKIPPFIATMGSLAIARSLALIYSGGYPVTGMPKEFTFIGSGYVWFLPTPILIAVFVFVISLILLNRSILGRYIYAIGGNEEAANLSGVNIHKWKIIIYSISGFLTAIAGIVLTARMNSGQPAAAQGIELDIIAAVVIGGTSLVGGEGNLVGTLIGALIITVISNGLTLLNVSPYFQGAIIGSVILIAVWLDRRR